MFNYNQIAQQFAQHRRLNPEVVSGLHSVSGISSDSKVLEVGCGTGNYIIAAEARAHCFCCGVDPSEQMLAGAQMRSSQVQFHVGQAESLEFPDDSYDLIFSVDAIHHIEDRAEYFQRAYSILKPGSKVCTVTDSQQIIRTRSPLAVYFPETIEVDLERYPRISKLQEIMEQQGFKSLDEQTVEFEYSLTDTRAYRNKTFSVLHLISDDAFRRGIERMEEDLKTAPIPCVSRYVMLWGTK